MGGDTPLAVLQVEDRVNTELNVYLSDWTGVVGAIIGYGIGFVIVYFYHQGTPRTLFQRKGAATAHGDPIVRITLGPVEGTQASKPVLCL
jgi:hypothetical protein